MPGGVVELLSLGVFNSKRQTSVRNDTGYSLLLLWGMGEGPEGFLEVQSRCSIWQCLNRGRKYDVFKIYSKVFELRLGEIWICYFNLETVNYLQIIKKKKISKYNVSCHLQSGFITSNSERLSQKYDFNTGFLHRKE